MKSILLIYNCFFLWTKIVKSSIILRDDYSSKEESSGYSSRGDSSSNELSKDLGDEHIIDLSNTVLENRIAGGEITSLEFFPFDVQFFNYGGMCGAIILAKKTVLTAAHCFNLNKDVEEMRILSNSRFVHDINANVHKVWNFRIHEKYNQRKSFANDIAVILIVDEFTFSPFVQKASLCTSEVWMRNNEKFYVSGWGETKYGNGISRQQLRMTYLNFVPKSRCEEIHGVTLTPDMFCLFGDGKRDTCRGDSGGGVVWQNMVIGIVSHGEGCVTKPAMYVNVSRLRPWIILAVNRLYNQFCYVNNTLYSLRTLNKSCLSL